MTPETIQAIVDAAGTLSLTAVLFLAVMMFCRGDILPRRVYEELTQRMMKEIVRQVKDEIEQMLKDMLAEGLRK